MSETASRLTLAEFIERHGVKMTATTTDHNPHMDNDRQMDHWRCTLTCGGRRMVLTFSKGMGHHGKPAELREVLSCIAMDTAGVENARDFADWCSEYGYDTDSRKAERTYRQCTRQAASLKRLLGSTAAFESLLWQTDQE